MKIDHRPELLLLCGDDTAAADFIVRMWTLFVVWDDSVDRDKALSEEEINGAWMWAMFGLHDDPFFYKYERALRPAIIQTIASWITANKFQRSGEPAKIAQAYFLRCSPYDLFATVVGLTAGFNKQLEAVEFFRSLAPDDTLEAFMKEHGG